jgi:hypothetical protein
MDKLAVLISPSTTAGLELVTESSLKALYVGVAPNFVRGLLSTIRIIALGKTFSRQTNLSKMEV